MKTRVTVTLDPELHAHAKKGARARRTTVSGLFAEFLRAAPSRSTRRTQSVVDEMIGCAVPRESVPGADPLLDALRARHLDRQGS